MKRERTMLAVVLALSLSGAAWAQKPVQENHGHQGPQRQWQQDRHDRDHDRDDRRWDRNDRRRIIVGPPVYRGYYERRPGITLQFGSPVYPAGNLAFRQGYADGLRDGQFDFFNGRGFMPTRSLWYRNADHGWVISFGARDTYQQTYRSAYYEGYSQGFRG